MCRHLRASSLPRCSCPYPVNEEKVQYLKELLITWESAAPESPESECPPSREPRPRRFQIEAQARRADPANSRCHPSASKPQLPPGASRALQTCAQSCLPAGWLRPSARPPRAPVPRVRGRGWRRRCKPAKCRSSRRASQGWKTNLQRR